VSTSFGGIPESYFAVISIKSGCKLAVIYCFVCLCIFFGNCTKNAQKQGVTI